MEVVRVSGRRAGILLAVMALAFALFPGTALASTSLDGVASAGGDTLVAAGAQDAAISVSVELKRQHPEWKLVCERTRDGSAVVCTRWRHAQCRVPRGEEVGMRNCAGNGPKARAIL